MTPEQQQRLRARIDELVRQGMQQKAVDNLGIWNRQFGYQPWIWGELGKLLRERGDRFGAGRAWFWAGRRGGEAQAFVDFYLESMRGRPERLLASIPERCRLPLADYPEALRSELQALGVTDRIASRAQRNREPWWGLLALGFILVAVAVGTYQILAAVWRWLASLFA